MKTTRLLPLLAVLALQGCLIARPDIPKPECEVDSECTDGKVCGPAGRCTEACKADGDCAAPSTCQGGACVLPAGRCARATDCTQGQVCAAGNVCAKACTAAADCSGNEACVAGACTEVLQGACTRASDCSGGQTCGPGGRCVDACGVDADCAAPALCQSGACVLPAGRCARDGDCATAQVCAAGNVCAARCTTATSCAANEACLAGACTVVLQGTCARSADCPSTQVCLQGRCAAACVADKECTPGTTCQNSVCAPITPECFANSDCAGGKACAPSGLCVAACTSVANCAATGEACSNGACVRVGADTAALAGAVVLTNVADRSGLTVNLRGPNRASATTAADGGYAFLGLLPGLYTVSVSASYTVEGTAQQDVAARVGVQSPVPNFTLTPAGAVRGNVTMSGKTSHEGVQLVALGTTRGAVTIPDGGFLMEQLPVGTYDLLATATGYQAAQITGVAVGYGQTTSTTPITLQPVPSGSTFAFVSTPPSTTRVGQPYNYQAVAGGGGVAAVTYTLISGPAGMTVNANTGQFSWTPTGVANGLWVVVSATGGGQVLYQTFVVSVLADYTVVRTGYNYGLDAADGGAWMLLDDRMVFLDDAGTPHDYAVLQARLGNVTALEHVNGRTITGTQWQGGTSSAVRGPVGTLGGTWEGGVVGAVSGVNVHTLQSAVLLGGTSGAAYVPTGDTVTGVSYPQGNINSVDAGVQTATGFSVKTGLLGTVSSTGFIDPAGTYTPDAHAADCVSNASGTVRIGIATHDATTFTLDADPTTTLVQGQRYFVVRCSDGQALYSVTNSNLTPLAISNRALDLYTSTQHVGYFTLVNNAAASNTFTFWAVVTSYPAIQNAVLNGFFALGTYAGAQGPEVTITDTTAPWSGATAGVNNLSFDTFTTNHDVIASTATTLTYRPGWGKLLSLPVGRKWVLTDTGGNLPITLTLATGGLAASVTGYLWVDATGDSEPIVGNTTNTITVERYFNQMPIFGWSGSSVGRSTNSGYTPPARVPTAGLVAGALVGRTFMLLTNGGVPLVAEASILWNDATEVHLDQDYCGVTPGCMATRLAAYSNTRWAPGRSSPRSVDFRLTVTGSPNFTVDALRGRYLMLERDRSAMGVIIANDANSVTVEVPEASVTSFSQLLPADRFWLSEVGSPSTSPLNVKVAAQGAAWTTDQWVGYSVVATNNQVAGVVSANTANELFVTVTNTAAFAALSAGANFALAYPHPQGTGCASPGVWIKTRLTLAGATLAPATYTHVRSSYSGNPRFALGAQDASGADAYFCASSFSTIIQMIGRPAVFDQNGKFDLEVEDASASYAVNALAGRHVYLTAAGGGRLRTPIASNSATTLRHVGIDSGCWYAYCLGGGLPSGYHYPDLLLAGAPYVIADASGEVEVTVDVAPPLTPGQLAGRYVRLNDRSTSNNTWVDYSVRSNGANQVVLAGVAGGSMNAFRATGLSQLQHLSLSSGTVVRVTDSAAAWTPGELVGLNVRLGSSTSFSNSDFTVIENSATSFVAVNPNSEVFGNVATSTRYSLDQGYHYAPFAVTPSGDAIVAGETFGAMPVVRRVTQSGAVSLTTPFTGAQALTVAPTALVRGNFATDATRAGFTTTWTDGAWTWTPGELVGKYLRVQYCSGLDARYQRIAANTATSITVYGDPGCNTTGYAWALTSGALAVTGASLTPGALVGKSLWVNGASYRIAWNTANEVGLFVPEARYSGRHLEVVEEGGKAFVLDRLPPVWAYSAAAESDSTFWLGHDDASLSRFDGTSWLHVPESAPATVVATGTVTGVVEDDIFVDTSATFTPGALGGKILEFEGERYTINTNTTNSIDVSGSWEVMVPTPGTSYRVVDNAGINTVQTLAATPGTLWVGTNSGLLRYTGGAWTRHTVASTESTPGARDGLVSDDVERLRLLPNGDLYASNQSNSGASRLRGGTWSVWSRATTSNGLPSDDVEDVYLDAAGDLWFSTYSGVARLSGTTWTVFGPQQGMGYSYTGAWVSPGGAIFLSTSSTLGRVTP